MDLLTKMVDQIYDMFVDAANSEDKEFIINHIDGKEPYDFSAASERDYQDAIFRQSCKDLLFRILRYANE